MEQSRIGCEFELPLLPEDPEAYRLGQDAFWNDLKAVMGPTWKVNHDAYTKGIVGMTSSEPNTTAFTYDASILLLELSLPPHESLKSLEGQLRTELAAVIAVCRKHAVRVLGYGMQPELDITQPDAKEKWRTPKGALYPLLDRRNWHHEQNLNIASTQPSIDVPVGQCIEYVNTIEKVLALLEPMVANSSIERWEDDRVNAERRNLLSWSKMLRDSLDKPFNTVGMPEKPYEDLRAYLKYLYSLPLFFVTTTGSYGDYKKAEMFFPNNVPTEARPPSIFEIAREQELHGKNPEGQARSVKVADLPPARTASVDYLNFRPARLRFQIDPAACPDWETFLRLCETNPEQMIPHTFIEMRSIAAQLPGEEMLPAALATGIGRGREALDAHLAAITWEEVRRFSRTRGFKFDAWDATVGGKQYRQLSVELLQIIADHLSTEEQGYLTAMQERVARGESPAMVASNAYAKSKEDFLDLVTHQS